MKARLGILAVTALAAAAGAGYLASRHQRLAQADHGKAEAKRLWTCGMHPTYISDHPGDCPICGMKLVPIHPEGAAPSADSGAGHPDHAVTGTSSHGVHIDPAMVQSMGVKTETVSLRELPAEVRTNGKITVDEGRVTVLNAKVMGWVDRLQVDVTGQRVRKGQTLLELYSPDLLATQEEYLQALRYAKHLTQATSEVKEGADALLASTRRRLLNWDIPESALKALEEKGSPSKTLPLVSPVSGTVIEKDVVQGQNIMPGTALYKLADLSEVWAVADIYQKDLSLVREGMPAEITLAYQAGRVYQGKVIFVSPVLDPASKTAQVRVRLRNTAALDLKPEMVATVRLLAPSPGPVVAVPEQAIIRTGTRDIAVLALGQGYFEPREVVLGRSSGGYLEIKSGLKAGDALVTSSQFLIDSESNLKAAIAQMQSGAPQAAGEPAPPAANPHAGHVR